MRSRLFAALVAAATLTGVVPSIGTTTAATGGGWHVFVYIVNDSETQLPYGQDVDEMLAASRSGIEFTVYLDSSDQAGTSMSTPAVPNVDDAIIFDIANGALRVTQRLGELDSGSPDTLAWFLAQGLLAHPSDHNALVVWDHGGGWNGVAFDEDVNSAGSRRTSSLDSVDISAALQNGLAAAGRDRLDLVVFDACLMASFDTLGAMAGNADYLIASEEVIPGFGLDYGAFTVLAQPVQDTGTIFDALATAYESEVAAAQPSDPQDFTLSMFDVARSAELGDAITAFAAAGAADVVVNPAPYLQATTSLHHYGVSGDFWFGFVDLGEYLSALDGVSPAVAQARDQLLAALHSTVIGERNGTPTFDPATGLTVYFPAEPRDFDQRFQNLPTSAQWMPFLDAYYNAQAGVILQASAGFAAEALAISTVRADIYQIEVPVTANFTGSVELVAATTDAAGLRHYFESDTGEITAAGSATAIIYPSLTTVSDGIRSVVPYTSYVRQADGTHGYSTFTLRRANGSIAQLNWDRKVDRGPFTLVDANGVVVAYTPQPGDLAYPVQVVQLPDGAPKQVPTDVGLDPNRVWSVVDDPIPDGTNVYLELRLLDANGHVIDTVTGNLVAGQP